MKIKYSRGIKKSLSQENIQELFYLSKSIIPQKRKHLFTFSQCDSENICVTHFVPEIGIYNKIILNAKKERSIPSEPVIIYNYPDCSYILMRSELED